MMNDQASFMAANAIDHAATQASQAIQNAAYSWERPSVLFRPVLSLDGNQWCALYGNNLHDGVAGFGDSPANAMYDFDEAWNAKIGGGHE